MDSLAHPSEAQTWLGAPDVETQLRALIDADKFHHGWILAGPLGVGKATLAYHIARALLRQSSFTDDQHLAVSSDDKGAHLVATRAHPDLFVAERRWDQKKERYETEISVETIRNLIAFAGRTASMGDYRVIIVDAADELNRNAANALLKVLEEPPVNTAVILVSHAPGKLLATIRSRCRRLDLRPLSDGQIEGFLRSKGFAEEARDIAAMSGGRPGYALTMASGEGGDGAMAAALFGKAIMGQGKLEEAIAMLTTKSAEARWPFFQSVLAENIAVAAGAAARGEVAASSAWASASPAALVQAYEEVMGFAQQGHALNLDRTQLLLALARRLKRILAPAAP